MPQANNYRTHTHTRTPTPRSQPSELTLVLNRHLHVRQHDRAILHPRRQQQLASERHPKGQGGAAAAALRFVETLAAVLLLMLPSRVLLLSPAAGGASSPTPRPCAALGQPARSAVGRPAVGQGVNNVAHSLPSWGPYLESMAWCMGGSIHERSIQEKECQCIRIKMSHGGARLRWDEQHRHCAARPARPRRSHGCSLRRTRPAAPKPCPPAPADEEDKRRTTWGVNLAAVVRDIHCSIGAPPHQLAVPSQHHLVLPTGDELLRAERARRTTPRCSVA